MARESLTYNYKKEEQFVELFGGYFPQIGIDPVTKQAIVKPSQTEENKNAEGQPPEERKESNPIEKFQEALALSERGKAYTQVMTIAEFSNFLLEMKSNN